MVQDTRVAMVGPPAAAPTDRDAPRDGTPEETNPGAPPGCLTWLVAAANRPIFHAKPDPPPAICTV